MIGAVLFDLDDTLFLQDTWLTGAWEAVAAAAAASGADGREVHRALTTVAGEGSARGRIIDRALEMAGHPELDVGPLVEVFRRHRPCALPTLAGVREGLERLRRRVPLGLVTDGDPVIQRGKLRALGIEALFDVVVLSDELGRAHRKPHPAPFERALARLGVAAADAVFVGDRPEKDIAGAMRVGMRAVRVRTGEYAAVPDLPGTWRSVRSVQAAIELVAGLLDDPAARPQPARNGAHRSITPRP